MNKAGAHTHIHEHNKVNVHCVVQVHMLQLSCQEREGGCLESGSGLRCHDPSILIWPLPWNYSEQLHWLLFLGQGGIEDKEREGYRFTHYKPTSYTACRNCACASKLAELWPQAPPHRRSTVSCCVDEHLRIVPAMEKFLVLICLAVVAGLQGSMLAFMMLCWWSLRADYFLMCSAIIYEFCDQIGWQFCDQIDASFFFYSFYFFLSI